MNTLLLVIGGVALTVIGLRLSKKNIDQGLDTTVRFRLRYTYLILFVLVYTAYVDNLAGEEQVVMIDYTNELLHDTFYQLEVLLSDAFDWVENVINTQ